MNAQAAEVLSQHPDLYSCLDDTRLEKARADLLTARAAYILAAEKALIAIGKTAFQDGETELSEAIGGEDFGDSLTLRLARQAL